MLVGFVTQNLMPHELCESAKKNRCFDIEALCRLIQTRIKTCDVLVTQAYE